MITSASPASAAAPSISSSSSSSSSSHPFRDRIFRRSSSFPSVRPAAGTPAAPRPVSASCASAAAAEREREKTGTGYYYSYYSSRGGGGTAVAAAVAAEGTLYDVLGVAAAATGQEIKAAYRKLARGCHPDVAGAPADEFMRIHAAYSTLSDPDKRADYDRSVFSATAAAFATRRRAPFHRPASPSYSSASSGSAGSPFPSGFARRTWETDQCW